MKKVLSILIILLIFSGCTDLFYIDFEIEKDARLDYAFITDNGYILDPLNPNQSDNFTETLSELKMPDYAKHKEIVYYENIDHGTLNKENVESQLFSKRIEKRDIYVYLPYNYQSNKKYKTIYFKDGSGYLKSCNAKNILDYMIYNKEIEPLVGVFIDSPSRYLEYTGKGKKIYSEFFINKIIPFIESKYSVSSNREDRILEEILLLQSVSLT